MTTRKLASFTSHLTYSRLSAHSREMAKRCMLDWLGVAIRGSQEKPAAIIRQVLNDPGPGEATVFSGGTLKDNVLNAAFCNGSASHSLDFDDLHNPSIIHLACVVVPGVFSIAEKEHASGKEMIAAVCAGYEAGARVGESVIPESYFFWHTTGTAGTFGAAAAAANLLHLDTEKTVQCYGSAGTQAAGLWEFLKEGAMSKSLHAGKSSYAGVLSAYLARAGFTGASRILEGEKGFCRAMVKEPHLEKLTEGLGLGRLKIDDNSFKPYACCKHSHAALYAIQTLRAENGLVPDDIDGIELHVNDITNYLINNGAPKNPYGCKFSIQYCCAAMMKDGAAGIEQFAPKAINDPVTRALMKKITVVPDAEIEKVHVENPAKLASKVIIRLKDGRVLERQVDFPKGNPDNPLSWEEAKDKFMHLAVPVYGEVKSRKLCELILHLEKAEDFAACLAGCLSDEPAAKAKKRPAGKTARRTTA